jgi:hypothetical protein
MSAMMHRFTATNPSPNSSWEREEADVAQGSPGSPVEEITKDGRGEGRDLSQDRCREEGRQGSLPQLLV